MEAVLASSASLGAGVSLQEGLGSSTLSRKCPSALSPTRRLKHFASNKSSPSRSLIRSEIREYNRSTVESPYNSSGLVIPRQTSASPVQPQAARTRAPPVIPFIMTPAGPTDLMSTFMRNRIIFVGSTINAAMAQKIISQLISLAAVNADEDIKMYINCPGGSTYSLLAIYDCMCWVKPDISTVGFGMCASQGALLLSAGAKGKRFAMPNTRIMIHQPQGGCGGTSEDVRRQVNEVMASRDKLDKMFSVFTGQPLETIQKYTERDRFFSAAEAAEFGLIDGFLETEY